ncbi:MAG TPA: adenylate/guanylate cyclase domain-containing protein, partial [Leptospiraceae bacterium]|nr:adenylate/guanylate cyclase domain-containing protein [Leptospiraceae bacterium]
ELLSEVGRIGKNEEESIPRFYPQALDIPSIDFNSLDLVIHISNFHHSSGGGLWDTLSIGEKNSVHSMREKSLSMDFFLAGSFLIMGCYHLGLYWLRKKDRSTFYFGLYCLLLSLHSLLSGECFLYQLLPSLSFQSGVKLNYLSFYVGTPVFIIFLKHAFSEDVNDLVIKFIVYPSFLLSLIVLFFPSQIFTATLVAMHVIILISCLYTIYLMFLCSYRNRVGAKSFLIGILVFTLFVIDDILFVNGVIDFGGQYGAIGFFWLIFFQSFVLSIRFSSAFVRIEDLSENLENQNRILQEQSTKLENQNTLLKKLTSEIFETNAAYEKFFPSQFIQLLEKDHITKLTLGDQMGREMSVLFSDIRSFTTLSESMSPKENFDFINGYLSRIGPFIRKYNGFIDKYMGDNIMALFDKNPNHAVDAGIEMLEELYRYNQVRMSKGRIPISIGIGIHTGNLTLGIIGEAGRMEGTVIADAVNLASRLEGLTKMYGASLLISEDMLNKMSNIEKYQFRKVDTVKVKGKNTAIAVIEIISGNSERITNLKLNTKKNFEEGVKRYLERDFSEAVKRFAQVLEKDPLDKAAKIHFERSLYYDKHRVPPNWEGVEAMETK